LESLPTRTDGELQVRGERKFVHVKKLEQKKGGERKMVGSKRDPQNLQEDTPVWEKKHRKRRPFAARGQAQGGRASLRKINAESGSGVRVTTEQTTKKNAARIWGGDCA